MQWRPSLWFALFLYSYFSSHKYLRQVLICRVSYFPRDVNIIRYVKGSRKTACGHNDFCSVRLNGPIWLFILTHRYRLSLSQFTEAVMVESATGPLLLCKSRSLPTQKCHAPPAVVESSRLINIVNPYNSATFVENRLLQTVPKQKGTMNTLMSGMGVPCTGTLRASVLSDSWAFGALATHCLMRALVPLGAKSSESVPERVLPYRH